MAQIDVQTISNGLSAENAKNIITANKYMTRDSFSFLSGMVGILSGVIFDCGAALVCTSFEKYFVKNGVEVFSRIAWNSSSIAVPLLVLPPVAGLFAGIIVYDYRAKFIESKENEILTLLETYSENSLIEARDLSSVLSRVNKVTKKLLIDELSESQAKSLKDFNERHKSNGYILNWNQPSSINA